MTYYIFFEKPLLCYLRFRVQAPAFTVKFVFFDKIYAFLRVICDFSQSDDENEISCRYDCGEHSESDTEALARARITEVPFLTQEAAL